MVLTPSDDAEKPPLRGMATIGKVILSLVATVGIGLIAIFVAVATGLACLNFDFIGDTPSGWWCETGFFVVFFGVLGLGLAAIGWANWRIWRKPTDHGDETRKHDEPQNLDFGLSQQERHALKAQADRWGTLYAVYVFPRPRRYTVRTEGAAAWGSPEVSVTHAATLKGGTQVVATGSHLGLLRVSLAEDHAIWVEESALLKGWFPEDP